MRITIEKDMFEMERGQEKQFLYTSATVRCATQLQLLKKVNARSEAKVRTRGESLAPSVARRGFAAKQSRTYFPSLGNASHCFAT
jgi:hypothetical protein